MSINGGWSPLSGPKVPAKAKTPSRTVSWFTGVMPQIPTPPTTDDGFMLGDFGSGGGTGGCGGGAGGCKESLAVNIATGALLHSYSIPENTLPVTLFYESDQGGVSELGENGWRANVHRQLQDNGGSVTITECDGTQVTYSESGSSGVYYPDDGGDNLVEEDGSDFLETLPGGVQYKYDSSGALINLLDPNGRKWTFSYDVGTTLTYVENHRGRRVTFHYDGAGDKITAIEDTAGRRTTLGYTSDKLSSITRPEGCVRSYYYSDSLITQMTDPSNYHTRISYSSSDVETVTSVHPSDTSKNEVTTFSYSTGSTRVYNPKNDLTTLSFDTNKHLTGTFDPEGYRTTLAWDSFYQG